MSESNLARLEQLTPMLPELDSLEEMYGPIVTTTSRETVNQIPTFGFGAYRDKDVGMMRLFVAGGEQVDAHVHKNEHQWLGVISGHMRIKYLADNSVVELNKFDVAHIEPGQAHVVIADVNSWCWTLTMPPAAGYPPAVNACKYVEASMLAQQKDMPKAE